MTLHWKHLNLSRIVAFCLFLGLVSNLTSQQNYSLRWEQASFSLTDSIACFDMQMSNDSIEPWTLAFINISVFFDASAGFYVSDSVVGDNLRSERDLDVRISSGVVTGSDLPFEDSLGAFRVSLSSIIDDQGEILDTAGTWVSLFQVCFKITLENITDPNTCFQMSYGSERTLDAAGAVSDLVQRWDGMGNTVSVPLANHFNLEPDRSLTACFVLDEDTDDLCSDGIDNDEDGLLDCQDSQCNPGNFMVDVETIECFRPQGSISFSRGNPNLQFSIDGGQTYSEDSIFSNLSAGTYDLVVRAGTVNVCSESRVVDLVQPDCSEADNTLCSDMLDNDNDGLVDCDDSSCIPRIDEVLINDPDECPLLQNGSIIINSDFPDVMFSIDSGMTYQPTNEFSGLPEGEYWVVIRNSITTCEESYVLNPVELRVLDECPVSGEVCNDGVDNDGDGLIDCLDLECLNSLICDDQPPYYIPNIISLGSNVNNVVRIESVETFVLSSFRIYDRWGGLVHDRSNVSTDDPSHEWNAMNGNENFPSGVYVYHLQIDVNGNIVHKTGNITVVN